MPRLADLDSQLEQLLPRITKVINAAIEADEMAMAAYFADTKRIIVTFLQEKPKTKLDNHTPSE